MSQYTIEAGTAQHLGDRDEQQDRVALLTAQKAPGYLMVVIADGMGGKSGGAMAAEQVIRTATQHFDTFSPRKDDVETMLRDIAHEAHTVIRLNGLSAQTQPHSTMAILVLSPERQAVWAHVGDSRLYHFRGPTSVHRTIDHSFVEKLVSDGRITRGEARKHRLSNVLTNVLGSPEADPFITVGRCNDLTPGSAFLLCTDGLWQHFEDVELGAAITMNRPKDAAEMLVRKARERTVGEHGDNCTFAIVKLAAAEQSVRQ